MTSASPSGCISHNPDLPNEILLLIIQKCPRSTLKDVRLASKSLEQMATPYLWRKVVLVPNDQCILGFVKALKRSKVVRYVTKLTYDARFGNFFHNIKNIPPDPSAPASEDKGHGERSLERAAQGRFQPYEDMAIEVAMLAKALRILPNLRELRVREHEDGSGATSHRGSFNLLKVPFFYSKMCNMVKIDPQFVNFSHMTGTSGRSYTKGILTAAFSAGTRLHEFKTKNVDGRAMFGVVPMKAPAAYQQIAIFRAVTDNLRSLELSFRNDTLITTANHVEAVQSLLKSAKKLKHLRLRLTDYSVTRCQYSDDDMSDLVALLETPTASWTSQPLVPRLETLAIDACICHDEDLIHLLKIHASTLKRLELANITLLGNEDRRECWVKLIKHLKTDLKLASITFSGWFSNGGRQQWFVAKDSVDPGRLKARVEKYVVDKRIRQCPLELMAIKPNQGDVEKPENGEEYEGDMTWTMIYSSPFTDNMDWQLAEPSFGLPSVDNTSGPFSASGEVSPAGDAGIEPWSDDEHIFDMEDGESMHVDEFVLGQSKKKQPKKHKGKSVWPAPPPPPSGYYWDAWLAT
ncbi:hypothetical protein LTR47_010080 [Exophiala xenobiotica]|nr:hypothetical protein LTR92_009864 [Exophiala xenobiotica]KAK5205561.1 hypothetical protein LTR41_008629 [Exophiala xenobiotica]KAK5216698.1 hypothetical protein LTR72_010366 [Exophiala xenobiotica]KAK5224058.1 hypothetical protein LTR47_010080 [Exophiala xenobiotica]KAK5249375.1 hypothetical protein LTS06_005741 [Exophiala xenobiotica]